MVQKERRDFYDKQGAKRSDSRVGFVQCTKGEKALQRSLA